MISESTWTYKGDPQMASGASVCDCRVPRRRKTFLEGRHRDSVRAAVVGQREPVRFQDRGMSCGIEHVPHTDVKGSVKTTALLSSIAGQRVRACCVERFATRAHPWGCHGDTKAEANRDTEFGISQTSTVLSARQASVESS